MTEKEWLRATDPQPMLEWLGSRGQLSPRKARLFAVGCCRRVWHLLTDERSRQGVEVAERFADHAATTEELEAACVAAWDAVVGEITLGGGTVATRAAVWPATKVVGKDTALDTGWDTVLALVLAAEARVKKEVIRKTESEAQAALLRCILGPLAFRGLPPLDPFVLCWNDRTIPLLAQAMRDQRDFSAVRMAILADALEDAGCTNEEILQHCREPGTQHARGCWVVDHLTGRS